MNKKKVTLVSLAVLLALGAFGFTAAKASQDKFDGNRRHFVREGRGPGGPGRAGRFFLRQLDLTETQKAQVKAIHENARQSAKPYHEQLKAIHEEMKAATANGTFDEATVRGIASRAAQVQVEMQVNGVRTRAEIYNILTAEQKTKLAELESKRAERRQNRRGPANNN